MSEQQKELKEIASREWTMEDGTKCSMTIKTSDGEPLSDEDQEFIRRFLPLAAGSLIDQVAPEDQEGQLNE